MPSQVNYLCVKYRAMEVISVEDLHDAFNPEVDRSATVYPVSFKIKHYLHNVEACLTI